MTITKKNNFAFSGLQIVTEQGVLQNQAVMVNNGVIHAVGEKQSLLKKIPAAELLNFPEDYYLVPGFIDMHVHGANGKDVMDATPAALATISETLVAEGTTSFLATTMTADIEQIENALKVVRDFVNEQDNFATAKILGVHLEGPFLSSKKIGAQRGDKILAPQKKHIQRFQEISGNIIKLVTLAPELPNSQEFIHYLKQKKIIASIGHTDATFAETMAAIDAGCSHATHLFNAMRGIHQREPGAVTAALLADNVMAELIVDGVHLHPAIVQLALRVKGKEKIILVTDAMRAKCLQDGQYDLGGQTVIVKNNIAQLADGTLAGSVLKMPAAIQNTLKFTGCTISDAVKMAAENPARALGIFDKKGSIGVKKDADLVVLDNKFNVMLVMCEGRISFTSGVTERV